MVHALVASELGKTIAVSNSLIGVDGPVGIGEVVEAVSTGFLAEKYVEPDIVFLDEEGFECHALTEAPMTLSFKAGFFVEAHAGAD